MFSVSVCVSSVSVCASPDDKKRAKGERLAKASVVVVVVVVRYAIFSPYIYVPI